MPPRHHPYLGQLSNYTMKWSDSANQYSAGWQSPLAGADGTPDQSTWTNTPGATASLNFTGVGIWVNSRVFDENGPFQVTLDGNRTQIAAPQQQWQGAPTSVYHAANLIAGPHSLVITNTPTASASAPRGNFNTTFMLDFSLVTQLAGEANLTVPGSPPVSARGGQASASGTGNASPGAIGALSSSNPQSSSSTNVGAMVGGVVGGVAALLLSGFLSWFLLRRRRAQSLSEEPQPFLSPDAVPMAAVRRWDKKGVRAKPPTTTITSSPTSPPATTTGSSSDPEATSEVVDRVLELLAERFDPHRPGGQEPSSTLPPAYREPRRPI